MKQDDIEYIIELLEDAIESQDWDLIEEARQYLNEFSLNRIKIEKKNNKNVDED